MPAGKYNVVHGDDAAILGHKADAERAAFEHLMQVRKQYHCRFFGNDIAGIKSGKGQA